MAAPSPTTRVAPPETKMDEGYQVLVTCEDNPDITFWDVGVKPPGIDAGDPIDTTTQFNSNLRTRAVPALDTMTDMTITAAWNPHLYEDIASIRGVNTVWTVSFPDTSTLAFWGYLRTFEPDEMTESNFPSCTVTITPTNQDTDGNEQDYVVAAAEGT